MDKLTVEIDDSKGIDPMQNLPKKLRLQVPSLGFQLGTIVHQ